MNNLKKILQMVVDYYNEVGCGCAHTSLLVFAQLSGGWENSVRLLCVRSIFVEVVVRSVYVAQSPTSLVCSCDQNKHQAAQAWYTIHPQYQGVLKPCNFLYQFS